MRSFNPPRLFKLKRVLVIDDDPICLAITRLSLEGDGLEVQTRSSGEAAYAGALPNNWAPDLILSDLHMPGLSGTTLAELLAKRWPKACHVAMTASNCNPDTDSIDKYVGLLQKPLSTSALGNKLAHFYRCCQSGKEESFSPPAYSNPVNNDSDLPIMQETKLNQLQKMMSNQALIDLLWLVLKDTGEQMDQIEQALAEGDYERVRQQAHRLRGSSGMIGATPIEKIAASLEAANNFQDNFRDEIKSLKYEYQRLNAFILQYTQRVTL